MSILNHIHEELVLNSDSSLGDSYVSHLFRIKIYESSWCQNCTVNGNSAKKEETTQENVLFLTYPDDGEFDFPTEQPWQEFNLLKILENWANSSREQRCSRCVKDAIYSVELKIQKFPKYLILVLKRFSSPNQKLSYPVKLPLHINLDALKYVLSEYLILNV